MSMELPIQRIKKRERKPEVTRAIGGDCCQFDSMKLSERQFVSVPTVRPIQRPCLGGALYNVRASTKLQSFSAHLF